MGNAETAGRTQGTPEEPSQAFSVLVADDEEGMREAMRRVLEKRGYQVELAENGARAIELIDKRRYDIALIDLRMPDVDGFAVTEHIARTKASRTVVVIVSALATVEAAVGTTRNGAFDFLVKPFNPDDLLRVVERAAAGDEPERGIFSWPVDAICRVFVFGIFSHSGHAEDGRDSVGERYIDVVTWP